MARTGKAIQVWFTEEMAAALASLADANGRTLSDELIAAARRHLAAPPVVVVTEPTLPPEEVPAGLKPKKGRPKGEPKQAAGAKVPAKKKAKG